MHAGTSGARIQDLPFAKREHYHWDTATGKNVVVVVVVVVVVNINSFVVKFEEKAFARFFKFKLIKIIWWTKESVMSNIHSLYSGVDESK
jgi:hypothetical protein